MNIFTYICTLAHTTRLHPLLCACEFYAGIRNRRSPFHRAHTQPDRVACVYMGDIKAIDAKHFATGWRITQHKLTNVRIRVFWVRVDLARIGMIAEFSTLRRESSRLLTK